MKMSTRTGSEIATVSRENLGYMLLASNLIDEVQMKIAVEEQKRTGRKFGSTLVDLKFIDENVLAAFLSKQIDVPCISLLNIEIPKKVLRRVPGYAARMCQAVPIRIENDKLVVAMADPTDIDSITKLEAACGMTALPLIAPQSSLRTMLERYYPENVDGDLDSTMASIPVGEQASVAGDPMFLDLIEELEGADLDNRLMKLEDRLDEIWVLLEKLLRVVESKESIREKISTRHLE